jgi:hypothetical protein
MAKIFEITDSIRQIASNAIDDLIDQLGKDVKLVYKPIFVPCDCARDLIGRKGPHVWQTGGPSNVAGPTSCVLCNGTGKKEIVATDNIKLLCNIDIKGFETLPETDIRVRQTGNVVRTKGYVADMPKVVKCDYAIFQVPLEGVQEWRRFD